MNVDSLNANDHERILPAYNGEKGIEIPHPGRASIWGSHLTRPNEHKNKELSPAPTVTLAPSHSITLWYGNHDASPAYRHLGTKGKVFPRHFDRPLERPARIKIIEDTIDRANNT